jgi:hypothetical protein
LTAFASTGTEPIRFDRRSGAFAFVGAILSPAFPGAARSLSHAGVRKRILDAGMLLLLA